MLQQEILRGHIPHTGKTLHTWLSAASGVCALKTLQKLLCWFLRNAYLEMLINEIHCTARCKPRENLTFVEGSLCAMQCLFTQGRMLSLSAASWHLSCTIS